MSGDRYDDLSTISEKYCLLVNDERSPHQGKKMEEGNEEERTETGLAHEQMSPVAVTDMEKELKETGFRNKLKVFRRGNETSSFSWSPRDECGPKTLLNIRTSAAVESDFKKLETSISQPVSRISRRFFRDEMTKLILLVIVAFIAFYFFVYDVTRYAYLLQN